MASLDAQDKMLALCLQTDDFTAAAPVTEVVTNNDPEEWENSVMIC